MRDILVLGIIIAAIPFCFFRPYFGLLMWTWVAFFNPHRMTFGMAYDFPVAMCIGIPTLAGLLFTRERNRNLFSRETEIMFALWAWFCVTTWYAARDVLLADHVVAGEAMLTRTSKILLMTVVTIILVTSQKKLRYLCYVTVLSIGFFAVKGAFFGLRTAGEERVWGPPGSFIEDNNFLAVAVNMTLPFLFFLARSEKNVKLRRLFWFVFICGIASVVLSYSRGGLLGLSIVLCILTLKSRQKLLGAALVIVLACGVVVYAPRAWFSRMDQIAHGNLDSSAQERLDAWHFAGVLASHYPLTGGGFETFTPDLYERFTPDRGFAGPHSIYFQMLGEQGYVGLGLFLMLLFSCHFTCWKLRRQARQFEQTAWVVPYTEMIQVSLVAYMVSGAFLAMAYFDYFWQIVAMTAILRILYRRDATAAMNEEPLARSLSQQPEVVELSLAP
jgi:probable O-glycosylation ligase (exosortase A-associated)